MKTENQWRDSKLRKFLDSLEECEYFIKEAKSIRGIPDIVGVWKSIAFYLEVKRSVSSLKSPRTALQRHRIEKFKKAGAFAEFIYPENAEFVSMDLVLHLWENGKISCVKRDSLILLCSSIFGVKPLKARKGKL